MEKELFKQLLTKYNYNFVDFNNIVTVKLEHAMEIYVDFNLFEKILISDRLTAWNFLTGFIPMKLRHAVVYNFSALLILAVLFLLTADNSNTFFLLLTFILAASWNLLWTIYYMSRSESLKQTFVNWLEK